ncbi:MAG: hypothetical protein WCS65_05320 [Verrucomicrobiae bacterium]
MKRLLLILSVLAALAAFPSCAGKKGSQAAAVAQPAKQPQKPAIWQQWLSKIASPFHKKQKPPAALLPQWTGVVRMVNAPEHFVLIEANAMAAAVPGETYLSVARGLETASLRMTSLKNPPFLIADIVTGTPSAGEKIYRPKTAAPPVAPTVASAPPASGEGDQTSEVPPATKSARAAKR